MVEIVQYIPPAPKKNSKDSISAQIVEALKSIEVGQGVRVDQKGSIAAMPFYGSLFLSPKKFGLRHMNDAVLIVRLA